MEDDLLLWPTPFELAFSFFPFLDNDVACYMFMFLKIVINYKFYGDHYYAAYQLSEQWGLQVAQNWIALSPGKETSDR